MRKILAVSVALLAGLLVGTTTLADTAGDATSHVWVNVDPNIAVQPIDANVDLGTVQTGDFGLPITFRVDANQEAVILSVAASSLYKGDDPRGTEVAPIPVNLSQGALIAPTNANPIGGRSNVAAFLGGGAPIGDFPASETEAITFESSQNGHFSQNVLVTVTWNQADPEKPTGEYSGKVKLIALLP